MTTRTVKIALVIDEDGVYGAAAYYPDEADAAADGWALAENDVYHHSGGVKHGKREHRVVITTEVPLPEPIEVEGRAATP